MVKASPERTVKVVNDSDMRYDVSQHELTYGKPHVPQDTSLFLLVSSSNHMLSLFNAHVYFLRVY